MSIVERRVHDPDQVLPVRTDAIVSGTPLPVEGGVGWRPGVPHIVIHMSDITGCCPFAVGEVAPEYVRPVSRRGVPVPVACLRGGPVTHSGLQVQIPIIHPPDAFNPFGWFERVQGWDGVEGARGPGDDDWLYERSGPVGNFDVAPSNAATLTMALTALAALDIAVVGVNPNTVRRDGDLPFNPSVPLTTAFQDQQGERTVDELRLLYQHGFYDPGVNAGLSPTELATLPDGYGGGYAIPFTQSAMALLTGAVKPDGRAMAYDWGRVAAPDSRWTPPNETDATEFVAFLINEVRGLAGRLGNSNQFDIALCLDNTGSFQGANTTAQRIFGDMVTQLRSQAADIWVAVSRYKEYGWFSFPFAGDAEESRPFILQYPVSPVVEEDQYLNMLHVLSVDTIGSGGDGPETQLEAFYQIATGVGFDGNLDGDTTDSGAALASGYINDNPADGEDWSGYFDHDPTRAEISEFGDRYNSGNVSSQGLGYLKPGFSGDVPKFSSHAVIPPKVAAVINELRRVVYLPRTGA